MLAHRSNDGARVTSLHVAAYRIPTDGPESDGTLTWDSTTIVVVQLRASGAPSVSATPTGRRRWSS